MDQKTRLRINLTTREIEVEGSEEFVREYSEKCENLLNSMAQQTQTPLPAPSATATSSETPMGTDLPPTFGEYLHKFPTTITDVDRMLIAAYFTQSRSSDNSFTTGDANKLLQEQGTKLTNPADCVNKNKNAKRVFTVQKGKYRVSQIGVDHLAKLLKK